MAVTSKPSDKPEWATGGDAQVIAPSGAKQLVGWISEKPPYQFFNWWMKFAYLWIDYFENRTDALLQEFDAIVGSGSGCSHASINAVMADAGIANIKRVLVTTSPGEDQEIDQPGMEFVFKPQATIVKDAAAVGLTISASKTKIIGATFSGFAAGGDKGILVSPAVKNCLITQCSFLNCSTDIDDQGANNYLTNNIVEE